MKTKPKFSAHKRPPRKSQIKYVPTRLSSLTAADVQENWVTTDGAAAERRQSCGSAAVKVPAPVCAIRICVSADSKQRTTNNVHNTLVVA